MFKFKFEENQCELSRIDLHQLYGSTRFVSDGVTGCERVCPIQLQIACIFMKTIFSILKYRCSFTIYEYNQGDQFHFIQHISADCPARMCRKSSVLFILLRPSHSW